MSCPEIAIHKKYHYGKNQELHYAKCTQKDYRMFFKFQIVQEIKRGKISISKVKKIMRFSPISQSINAFKNLLTLISTFKHLQICQNLLAKK